MLWWGGAADQLAHVSEVHPEGASEEHDGRGEEGDEGEGVERAVHHVLRQSRVSDRMDEPRLGSADSLYCQYKEYGFNKACSMAQPRESRGLGAFRGKRKDPREKR
jgi:hypothetical protein